MDTARTGNNIVEIGFNAGHSALLMLEANKNCHIHVFDICEHTYTQSCFNYLQAQYGNRMTMHKGDSHIQLKAFKTVNPDYHFNIVHIDGNHEYYHANIDFFLAKELSQTGAYCILDDTNIFYLHRLWQGYVSDGHLTEMTIRDTGRHRHSIGTFI